MIKMKLIENCGLGKIGDVVKIETAAEASHLTRNGKAEPVAETAAKKRQTRAKAKKK